MIRLLENTQRLTYQQFLDIFCKPEADPNKLYDSYSRQEVSDILSNAGLYMRFADISIRTNKIVIFCTAHLPGILTEAVLEIVVFPESVEAQFEIPNYGNHTVSESNPSEWEYCVKAWNEVTVPQYQKNIAKNQGYEFLS